MNELFAELNALGADTKTALGRFIGDSDMYISFLYRFSDDPCLATIRDALNAGDEAAASNAIHMLKGISGNLGLDPVMAEAQAAMVLFRSGKGADAMLVSEGVLQKVAIFTAVIDKHKNA